MCVCVCVRACVRVRACVHACVSECVRVCVIVVIVIVAVVVLVVLSLDCCFVVVYFFFSFQMRPAERTIYVSVWLLVAIYI